MRRRLQAEPRAAAFPVVPVLVVVALVGVLAFALLGGSKPMALMTDEELAREIVRARAEDHFVNMRKAGYNMSDDDMRRYRAAADKAIPDLVVSIRNERARGRQDEELRREFRERSR